MTLSRTDRLTRKQFIKRKTHILALLIHSALLPEEYRKDLTMAIVLDKFPKVSYYKQQRTGEIRVGLSLRGIKKLIKKYPLITDKEVMEYFNARGRK